MPFCLEKMVRSDRLECGRKLGIKEKSRLQPSAWWEGRSVWIGKGVPDNPQKAGSAARALAAGQPSKRDFCGKGGMERSPFRCGIGGQFRSAGTRARILGKRKGPERDLAPGPCLVPLTGVEPVRYHYLGILSPVCLPISPQRLIQVSNKILYITTVIKSRNARVQPFSRHKKGDGINPSPLFYFSIVRSDRYQNYSYSLASLVRCSYLSSAILAARSNSLSALSGKERFSEL